jgi:EAL domain-containing protein (putative c-di-GMP-specific phosphodiesterase class I)
MGRSSTLHGDPVPENRWSEAWSTDELCRELLLSLEPHLRGIVDDLYDRLVLVPEVLAVVQRLTPVQFAHLKARQVAHLRLLLSPSQDPDQLRARSREAGRVHAMTGVEMDWYVDAVADHRGGILAAIARHAPHLDRAAVQALVNDRFMADLQGQLLGFRDLDEDRGRVLIEVLDVASTARTVADLTLGLAQALGRLQGMAVALFVRQDEAAQLAYEVGSGPGFEDFLAAKAAGPDPAVTSRATDAHGRGPMGEAWRSGEIRTCESWQTDPSMRPWVDFARGLHWKSSACVPLADRSGQVRALLNLQAYWPGYFASGGRAAMLEQVKRVTERAVVALDEQASLSSGVSSYTDRRRHLDLLADGQVQMLFQPIVALPSGGLRKLEALARLRDGDRLVSPAEFLPAFGDDELFSLFDVGLRQSLDALECWDRRGLRTGVSLNLPVVAAEDDRYAHLVARLLHQRGVDPGRLTLELLETGVVDREVVARRPSIDMLKELGVRLAQDDLGSGHSSLLRLRHFAFDDVKIDRGLIRNEERSPGSALHFIGPISNIAHSLGLTVVIEGLEDEGLIEAAVQLGVDEGQGYGIARPMPAHDVVDWAAAYRLDVDVRAPRTPIGALAAHVRWEHRARAGGDHPDPRCLGVSSCALTGFLQAGDPELVALHESVHHAALSSSGSPGHRGRWERLATGVTGA